MTRSFFLTRTARILALVFLFGSALAIRLYDLTDLPLDFHPTRQLVSIIKARGIYYETHPAGVEVWQVKSGIRQAQLKADVEPVVFERLAAFTYGFTGEKIWVARIYSSLFWLAGGVFLFLLARDLVSFDAALVAAGYFLFFPYAVFASRSFQPDPLMVMLILAFWWLFFRWTDLTLNPSPTGRRAGMRAALLAGLVGGFAIYVKFSAAFFVIGGALGLALTRLPWRDLLRNAQVWAMAALGMLPAAAYLVYGIFFAGYLGGQFSGRFIPALLLNPLNYLAWQTMSSRAAGSVFIALGLLGFALAREARLRGFLAGVWVAYLAYGFFFDYHVATHDYYHLPLIPIVAVSLGPLGGRLFADLAESTSGRWMRRAVVVILLYVVLAVVWDVRNEMKAVDYRPQAAMWAEIGERLEHKRNVAALTQDYGSRLGYWGLTIAENWYTSGDQYYAELRGSTVLFDRAFDEVMERRDYFLVTDFDELKLQPELKTRLARYQIFAEGEGYVIYNLRELK